MSFSKMALWGCIIGVTLSALPTSSFGQTLTIPLDDPRKISPATGVASIAGKDGAPDVLLIKVSKLEPNQDHAVFLAASPFVGSLPVQFLGVFRTGSDGTGTFSAITEVLDAYAAANPSRTDPVTGLAPPLAGVLANGAFPIPLDWIRIYRARSAGLDTVFSRNGREPGGGHLISTTLSFDGKPRPPR